MAVALPLLLCAAVLCCYCCTCCYGLLFSVDEHSTSSLTERLNGKGGGEPLVSRVRQRGVKHLGMGLLCSKIHPSCYARMPQTLSNYALVALLCSCSKLISASPRCSHQQISVLINPLECNATQVLSKQTTTKEVSDMKHPVWVEGTPLTALYSCAQQKHLVGSMFARLLHVFTGSYGPVCPPHEDMWVVT